MKLDREEFRAWLTGLPHTRRFRPTDAESCPIAAFIRARGAGNVYVWTTHAVVDGNREPFPRWACRFIRDFDGAWTEGKMRVASRKAALSTLDAIPTT